jgi:hypothetical protein
MSRPTVPPPSFPPPTAAAAAHVASQAVTTAASPNRRLAVAALVGGLVAVSAGVYAKAHTPTYRPIIDFGFPSVIAMKAWFTTVAFGLGIAQVATALAMWGKLPGRPATSSSHAAAVHRWTGTAAFVATLPVAYHCLWSLGFSTQEPRQVVHGLLGCLFYGVFATKMLSLRIHDVSPRLVPLLGGVLVTVLTAVWLSSSVWFFINLGFPFGE